MVQKTQTCSKKRHVFIGTQVTFRPKQAKTGQNLLCWGHVGTFFVLGRLFFALGWLLGACWAFVARLGRFFRVLGRSGSDFGGSKLNFGGSTTSFFDGFSRAGLQCNKTLDGQKPKFFLRFCCFFLGLR